MPRLIGITFDLDDTLYDNGPVLERAEQVLHDWLAQHYPRLAKRFDIDDLRDLRKEVAQQHPNLCHDLTRIRKMALAQAGEKSGYGHHVAEPAFNVFHQARNEVEIYGDVRPTLRRLQHDYVLAALSNGNADITRLGLDGFFEFSVSAVDAGAAKPDPAMFIEAVRRIGTTPERIVHVGDDPLRDVAGAAAVGLRTVWVNRLTTEWPGNQRPDAEIRSLDELPEVMQQMD